MKLLLTGHAYRYATEQILLHAYPSEKPEFIDTLPPDGLRAEVKISRGAQFVTAATAIYDGGERFRATARVACAADTSALLRDRLERRALQKSFFKAAQLAGQTGIPWGAAAGIRPSTLVTKLLSSGMDERSAIRAFRNEYFVSKERAALALDCAKAELDARKTFGASDVALYIGIPFCPTRCAYCTFVSNSTEKTAALIEPFLSALYNEIGALSDALDGTGAHVACVYIGGGTPTTLTAEQLDALMSKLADAFDLSGAPEYTVEAGRPDTITAEKLAVMKRHGVNRVSVNPQTFDDGVLRVIGRRHTADDAYAAYRLARDAGFASVNMDLIAGLPSDTYARFVKSLDAAVDLAPENVTVHALSRKKGSRVTVDEVAVPDGDTASRMIDYSVATLRRNGYAPYYLYRQKYSSGGLENTGWTKPGHAGLYNIAMMDEALTVLALGGGGVTKLISNSNRIERIFNAKYPYEYIQRAEICAGRKREIRDFLLQDRK